MSQVSRTYFSRCDKIRHSVSYIHCRLYIFTYPCLTGSLRFGKVDVTEAQFTIIGIHLVSAIFGPKIWMMEVVSFFFYISSILDVFLNYLVEFYL